MASYLTHAATGLTVEKLHTAIVKVVPRADDHELLLLNWFDEQRFRRAQARYDTLDVFTDGGIENCVTVIRFCGIHSRSCA